MCGIAGIYHLNGRTLDIRELDRMTRMLSHRGPDDWGFALFQSSNAKNIKCFRQVEDEGLNTDNFDIGFGHRRLSIIDLSDKAHQPMGNEDNTVWITYNGEIYNFRELKAQLEATGNHFFTSRSDTEVIIHAYEEWGEEAFKKLNGIFAFALWDAKQNQLLIVRDRFGVKPVYYTIQQNSVIFASEIKSIFEIDSIEREINYQSLAEHFTFQNTFGEKTFYKNIFLLGQGSILTIKNGSISKRTYYDIEYKEDYIHTEKFYTDRLRQLFEDSVKRQLVSDVPLGTYLSGGMDTGSISAVASEYINPLHTFTCGFDISKVSEEEKVYDERAESHKLSAFLGTSHHETILSHGFMEKVFPKVIWHLDEPRVGISYQVYYIAELVKEFVTIVLSGVGGDEFFAGYPWRYKPILNLSNKNDFDEKYYRLWIRFIDDNEKKKFFSDEVNSNLKGFSTLDSFKEIMNPCSAKHPLNRAMYFDAKTFLNGLLIVDDKLSMAHSVEARVPFLDNELIEFILTIPPELKFKNGNIKYILKNAMKGLLPEETFSRRKQGFTPPDKSWYKSETINYIRDLILSQKAVERNFFKKKYVGKILEEHLSGRKNHRFFIWSLMSFEWMNRIFIDREVVI